MDLQQLHAGDLDLEDYEAVLAELRAPGGGGGGGGGGGESDADAAYPESGSSTTRRQRAGAPSPSATPAAAAGASSSAPKMTTTLHPPTVDDFVRNYFVRCGLSASLEAFNTEWYASLAKRSASSTSGGAAAGVVSEAVPDVYAENEGLSEHVTRLRGELEHAREVAARAQSTWDRFRKERDFHRMHHKRVAAEKNTLIRDLRRLQAQVEKYSPVLQELRSRHDIAIREKALARLERDRFAARVEQVESEMARLQAAAVAQGVTTLPVPQKAVRVGAAFAEDTILSATAAAAAGAPPGSSLRGGATITRRVASRSRGGGAAGSVAASASASSPPSHALGAPHWLAASASSSPSSPSPSPLPEDFQNPHRGLVYEPARCASYGQTGKVVAHGAAVSSVAYHPSLPIALTASDDTTWKAWEVTAVPPRGTAFSPPAKADLRLSGSGHSAWLSDAEFRPSGDALASSAGDGVIKVWSAGSLLGSPGVAGPASDYDPVLSSGGPRRGGDGLDSGGSMASVTSTAPFLSLTEHGHKQAVWSVSWHASGDFLVSGGMDHTARLWDVTGGGRAIATLRGHVDSVNSVCFQPYSASVATASGDKTVSLWDTRTGMCVQTFFGHTNAVSDVAFALGGDALASCDADGVVRIWDTRMVAEQSSLQACLCPINGLAFDRSGRQLAAACEDGVVRVLQHTEMARLGGGDGDAAPASGALKTAGRTAGSYAGGGGGGGGATARSSGGRGAHTFARVSAASGALGSNNLHAANATGGGARGSGGRQGAPQQQLAVVATLSGHTDAAQSVVFDSTSQFLLSAGNDGTMRVWSDWDVDVRRD